MRNRLLLWLPILTALALAPRLLGVRCVGATDDQPLTVIGNGEARTVEMLPQFGDRRRVEQSKSHQAADLTSALRRGSSTAQTRGRSPIWPVLPNKARVSLVVSRGRRG